MMLITRDQFGNLRRLLPYLEVRKLHFVAGVLLGVISLGASIGLAAVSAWLIARASQMPPVMYLNVAVTAVRALGISKALFRYFERLASHHVALDGIVSLRVNIFRHVAALKADNLARLGRGQLLSRITSDVDALGDLMVRVLHPVFVTSITAALTVSGMLLLCPPAAAWLAVGLLFSIVGGLTLSARATRNAITVSVKSEEGISSLVSEMFTHDAEIRALGKSTYYRQLLHQADSEFQRSAAKATRATALASAMDNLGLGIALIGCTLTGSAAVASGNLSYVGLAVVVLTPLAAFEGTAMLPNAASGLVRCAVAAERLTNLIDSQKEPQAAGVPAEFPAATTLSADNLRIGWDQRKVILESLSLVLNDQRKVALVGPSGIGKTTLLLTLCGMLDPLDGTVLHAGIDAGELPSRDRAKLVTFTPEDAHIFNTSVYENIRVGNPEISRAECTALLQAVHLGSWLESLPNGLDTALTSAGSNVSGGERRRILIARALASTSPLLLLDEPGEHLDPQTADALVRDLLRLEDRGIVLVTHRVAALEDVDTVILLDYDRESGRSRIGFCGTFEDAKTHRFVEQSLENE